MVAAAFFLPVTLYTKTVTDRSRGRIRTSAKAEWVFYLEWKWRSSERTVLCDGKGRRNEILMHGHLSHQRWHMLSSTHSFLVSKDGRKISNGDCALFRAGNAPPFIGIIRHQVVDEEGDVKLGVNWLYRPANVKLGKGASIDPLPPNEVFYSFHQDEISGASLLHPCKVAFLSKGVQLPSGVSAFVYRRVYDVTSKCLWWLTDRDYTNGWKIIITKVRCETKFTMTVDSGAGMPFSIARNGRDFVLVESTEH